MRMGALVLPPLLLLLLLLQAASAIAAAAATAVRDKNRVPCGLIRSSFQFFKWSGGNSQPPLSPPVGPRNGAASLVSGQPRIVVPGVTVLHLRCSCRLGLARQRYRRSR